MSAWQQFWAWGTPKSFRWVLVAMVVCGVLGFLYTQLLFAWMG